MMITQTLAKVMSVWYKTYQNVLQFWEAVISPHFAGLLQLGVIVNYYERNASFGRYGNKTFLPIPSEETQKV